MHVNFLKSTLIFILFTVLGNSTYSQSTPSINLIFSEINNNTKNYQVSLDGNNFFSNKSYSSNNNNQNMAVINNLKTGKHTIKIYRLSNPNPKKKGVSNKILVSTKPFMVRAGYDLDITVNSNGGIQFNEYPTTVVEPINYKTPMADAKFNQLIQSVRNKFSQALKGETESEAFNNPNNYFTSSQVRQLLALMTSESDRLDLAKISYRSVLDSSNFTLLYDLFKVQANKNDLNDFLRSKGWNIGNDQTTIKTPMADTKFNPLLQSVRNKFSQALKGETESEAFNNPNNYFTTSQVRQLLILMTSESDRLDLAKRSYRSVLDSSNFTQLYDLFKVQANKNDLNDFLRTKGWNIGNDQNTIKTPMADTKFNQLLQSVRNKFSQALKGETESEAFNNLNNYFTTSQVKQLLTLMTSESDRLDLAKLSYRSVLDSANFTLLYDLFNVQANRNDLNDFLRSKGWNIGNEQTTTKTPMGDADFAQLVSNVRGNLIQFLKVNYLRDVFNTSTNYFSTNQVRQLLLLINAENNRLELAKLSYRTITDPLNFLQLNNLFDSQGGRDELTSYVKNYQH